MTKRIRDQTGLALWESGDPEASIHAFRGRPAFPEEITEDATLRALGRMNALRHRLVGKRNPLLVSCAIADEKTSRDRSYRADTDVFQTIPRASSPLMFCRELSGLIALFESSVDRLGIMRRSTEFCVSTIHGITLKQSFFQTRY